MSFFTDFYLANTINPVLMILIYWLFWPGLMFLVAAVFESRKVHLGKGQSRMFFPGDFMLGIIIVMIIGMHAKNPVGYIAIHLPFYWMAGAIFHGLIAFAIRTLDIARYPPGSRNSPTKLIHDFCGYFFCAWLIAGLGLPQLSWCIKTSSFTSCATEWIIFIIAAAFFIAMTIWDITHPATRRDLLLMHPDKYHPIWKK